MIAPSVTSTVTLDLNNGKLTVKVDETVDVNPTSLLDLSKIHIENMTNDAFVTLTGAQSVVSSENEVFTVYLNEQQRVNAIEKSNQPGGDGTQLLIRIEEEAIADMAGLRNKQLFMFSLSEIADTTRPAFVSATLNFSTGTLVISMTETIDTTPISLITASRYSLKHSYGETITLSGSTPTAFDSTSVTLTMTEDVRARVLRISAMRGGLKGGPGVLLDVDAVALQDIGENPNDAQINISVSENEDIVTPSILSCTIAYGTGEMTITSDETMRSDLVDVSKIYLSNSSGQKGIQLAGAAIIGPSIYGTPSPTVTIVLTELQRVAAIAFVQHPRGGWN